MRTLVGSEGRSRFAIAVVVALVAANVIFGNSDGADGSAMAGGGGCVVTWLDGGGGSAVAGE
jgi:hypothetical protein